ncbi:hypothetical protein DKM44_12980 [Deinococcus irradiatisoli]|uniref:Uncharacterized protein n=1 Tax=Deinococcus irradiatisoli TaxID=2202254 RepID=A0A2Z3JGB5_9DEIO|nr:hypothetical protein [Deinococcus irradiatisoli]AWN24035.1 hypothetical protein DKM44_12980 [Deinococcus irradiatisoli]
MTATAHRSREAHLDHVQDVRRQKKIDELQRRGVRALCCDRCGMNSGLSRYFEGCNASRDDGSTCEGGRWVEVMGK